MEHRRGAAELTIKPCPLAARTCCTHHPRHTVCHHLRDPKHCHSPNSVLWTMVDCARPRLHRPKHAFAPRSHKNQTSQGLDPNLYTRINTIAPTPHANFGRGQLFPITANPFTMLGHMPPPPHSTFHPFLPNAGTHHTHTHTHIRLRPKTTTLPHSTTPVFLNFHLLMLGFG